METERYLEDLILPWTLDELGGNVRRADLIDEMVDELSARPVLDAFRELYAAVTEPGMTKAEILATIKEWAEL